MLIVREAKTSEDRAACLDLRRAVFIEEQQVPASLEIDELEDACVHFLALVDDAPVGTARLLPASSYAKAQRVAVRQDMRGRDVGRALMRALEDHAKALGFTEVRLGAQVSAIPFYLRLGYEAYGELFDDAGIPHRMMRRALDDA